MIGAAPLGHHRDGLVAPVNVTTPHPEQLAGPSSGREVHGDQRPVPGRGQGIEDLVHDILRQGPWRSVDDALSVRCPLLRPVGVQRIVVGVSTPPCSWGRHRIHHRSFALARLMLIEHGQH
ncbi:hypothetical protein D9M72_442450 [compost metagenome]